MKQNEFDTWLIIRTLGLLMSCCVDTFIKKIIGFKKSSNLIQEPGSSTAHSPFN